MENDVDFDEFDEAELDAIIAELLEMAEYYGGESEPKEVSPDKVERVRQILKVVKTILKGDRLKAEFVETDLIPHRKDILVTGNNVSTEYTEALALIMRTADVVELSPRIDGRADLGMGFSGLTK